MFNAKPLIKRFNYGVIALLLLAIQAIPMAALWSQTASAADTTTLYPNGQGTYTAWTGDENDIDETGTPDCEDDNNDGDDNIASSTADARESVNIDLSDIDNGSTITGVDVQVSYRDAASQGDDGTFQTFTRLNGTDTNSGANLTASSDTCISATQTINTADTVKNNGTTLEVGVLKTANDTSKVWVGTIRAVVTYSEVPPVQPVQPVTNPSLAQSCGLDVALVLDNSGSISSGELSTMKNAMQSFTTAFNGTPTQFSVTRFATTASVQQSFTDDIGDVNDAIDGIGTTIGDAQYTNWEDGLSKAQSTFDPRPAVPNMVIFASDGNPNTVGNGPGNNASPDGSLAAMNPAVTVANSLKTNQNAHILSLGIGDNLSTSNLEKVSGPGDVISSDFDSLAGDLAELAAQLCGGTITTTKLVDHDSNPNTPAINGGAGWNFSVDGNSYSTDANGQTVAVDVGTGTYNVTETVKDGYALVSGSCSGATNNGQFNQASQKVEGILVDNNDIVSCQFVNKPTKGTLIVNKVINGGNASYGDFQFKVNNGNPVAFEGDGSNEVTVNEGNYSVEETNIPAGYNPSYSNHCSGEIAGGQTKTCTITNTYAPAPKLTLKKVVINDNGGTAFANAWTLKAQANVEAAIIDEAGSPSNSLTATTQTVDAVAGKSYTLSEYAGPGGYAPSSWSCVGGNGNELAGNVVTLEQGENVTCAITNDDISPKVIVKKIVKNSWGGTKESSDFLLYLNGNQVTSGTENTVNTGNHTASEANLPGYFGKFSGDCDPSGNISVQLLDQVYECVITNYDKPGVLIVKKKVINDDGGHKKAKDFKFTVNHGYPTSFTKYGFNVKFVPRGHYTVKEVYAPGYETYYHGCKNIYVKNGETKTCYITNNDIAPKLTLKKIIAPEERYGNDSPSDWTLSATPVWPQNSGASVIEGNGDPFSGNGVFYEKAVAGVFYKLSETGPAGYDAGEWACYGKKGTYHIFHGDKLWMKPGAKVFCKIVNTEKPPKLTVIKHVINNDGRQATVENFGLNINGDALTFDGGVYDDASKTTSYTATLNVYAGQEYVLSEQDLADYAEGTWVCSNETVGEGLSINVVLSLGDDVTCEITNDDIPSQPPVKPEEPPVIPSVITLPNTTGINPVLVALSLGALTAIVMSGSMAAKIIVAKRR